MILVIALLFGARLQTSAAGVVGAFVVMTLYMLAFVGFANGMALRSKSIGGYHTLLFLLNLPLLFLSNALLPAGHDAGLDAAIAYINPTTYVVDGLRQTLFANGSLPLWLSIAVLTAIRRCCLMWFGVKSFRKVV